MKNTPINYEVVTRKIKESGINDLGKATIREIVALVNNITEETGDKFVRMEMGVPGIKPPEIATNAEIQALKNGVARDYPMLDGIKEIKTECSKFIKNFMDIDIKPEGCIPTTGAMQGGYAAFLVAGKCNEKKDTALFIDPGFPVQKQQFKVLNYKFDSFDVYNYRGAKLKDKLESFLKKGNINSIIYSNPNNPTWVCLNEEELKIIGELANKYDVLIIEDLAYFGMDFRRDISKPGVPPYQPTVAKYTDNYILLISSSKVFSYAGQRMAMLCISDKIFHRKYPDLKKQFNAEEFGYVIILRVLYALSSGASHSSQYALAAMFKACNEGRYNFVEGVREYAEKAKTMKKLFLENGFKIVYDKDIDQDIADGFYFTISYPGFSSGELIKELLYYGVSAISLINCGSNKTEGLRACVSQTQKEQFPDLEYRLKRFHEDHAINI
ncbi:MAG: pyridoxal phosphate-dependent aminotransferase [Bacteroidales bacterium]|nr:pyridoxal phosphate-dependent aminotransferase [Bacteroidales bacterium]